MEPSDVTIAFNDTAHASRAMSAALHLTQGFRVTRNPAGDVLITVGANDAEMLQMIKTKSMEGPR